MQTNYAPAQWWPRWCLKCVSGLRTLEKSSTFWNAYKSWTWCSNVFHTWVKEFGNTSFFLHCVVEYSWILNWNEIFSSVGQVLGRGFRFLVMHFYGNFFSIGLQKGFDHNCIDFGFSCCNIPRFVVVLYLWTKVSNIGSLVFLFWQHEVFSMISSSGILVCFLMCPTF